MELPYSFQHRQDRGHVALGQGDPTAQDLGRAAQRTKMRRRLQASLEPGGAEGGGVIDLIILRQQTTNYSAAKLSAKARTETSEAQPDPFLLFFSCSRHSLMGERRGESFKVENSFDVECELQMD